MVHASQGKKSFLSLITVVQLILFAMAIGISFKFCSVYTSIFNANRNQDTNEHEKAFGDFYQAIKHFDPQFDKTSKKIFIKMNDYSVYGFNSEYYCGEGNENCVCLCKQENCKDVINDPEKKKEKCKLINYKIKQGILLPAKEEYLTYTVYLEEDFDTGNWVVNIKND